MLALDLSESRQTCGCRAAQLSQARVLPALSRHWDPGQLAPPLQSRGILCGRPGQRRKDQGPSVPGNDRGPVSVYLAAQDRRRYVGKLRPAPVAFRHALRSPDRDGISLYREYRLFRYSRKRHLLCRSLLVRQYTNHAGIELGLPSAVISAQAIAPPSLHSPPRRRSSSGLAAISGQIKGGSGLSRLR